MSRPRAVAVVTGSELVRGERHDRNGPFLMQQAVALGLRADRILVVGDDPEALERALREGATADVCLVSGGLGPTHDDRTVEFVARIAGRALVLDQDLEARIAAVSRGFAQRLGTPFADFAAGVTKQATIPEGAIVLGIAGTAPGLVVEARGCVFVVLPGPPGELQRLWPAAPATEALRAVLARVEKPSRRMLRFFGAPESTVAQALAEAGGETDGVEVTICAHDFEIHLDIYSEAHGEGHAAALAAALRSALAPHLFTEEDRSIAEIVLGACRERGLTLATAESCTGGMVAARLTDLPGSSDVFLGGVVAYSDTVKRQALGVLPATLATHGAVSAETAAAMAEGARVRLGADVAVAVTGVAGPGGGSDAKPVGLVHFHAVGPDGNLATSFEIPGRREWVRTRGTVAALHLVRRLLEQSRHEGG